MEVPLELLALTVGCGDEPSLRCPQLGELGSGRGVKSFIVERDAGGRGDLLENTGIAKEVSAVHQDCDGLGVTHHGGRRPPLVPLGPLVDRRAAPSTWRPSSSG